MTEQEHGWHGWSRGDMAIRSMCIGPLPGRTSIALYEQFGGRTRVLAWFRSVSAAEEARDLMDALTDWPCGFGPRPPQQAV